MTLDLLFSMDNPELEQLLSRCTVEPEDIKKLLGSLDLLTTYYGECVCQSVQMGRRGGGGRDRGRGG